MIVGVEKGLNEIIETLECIHECELYQLGEYKGVMDVIIYANTAIVEDLNQNNIDQVAYSLSNSTANNKGTLMICARHKDTKEIKDIIMERILLDVF